MTEFEIEQETSKIEFLCSMAKPLWIIRKKWLCTVVSLCWKGWGVYTREDYMEVQWGRSVDIGHHEFMKIG